MKSDELHFRALSSIPFSDVKKALPTFSTKKAALAAGKQYGWKTAIKMVDRFEQFWCVGMKMFQSDEVADVTRDHYRMPLLRWERRPDGVEHCPVLNVFVVR